MLIIIIVLSFFGTSKQKQNIVNANTQISNSRDGVYTIQRNKLPHSEDRIKRVKILICRHVPLLGAT